MTKSKRVARRIRWLFQEKIQRLEREEFFLRNRLNDMARAYGVVRDDPGSSDAACDRAEREMKLARRFHVDAQARLAVIRSLMKDVLGIVEGKS